jgi:hypothetical protein
MKKCLFLSAVCGLIFLSCDTGNYPPYTYTNTSSYVVSFKTRETDSPVYRLDPGTSKVLDSGDGAGRTLMMYQ